jgi:hypothetical protein
LPPDAAPRASVLPPSFSRPYGGRGRGLTPHPRTYGASWRRLAFVGSSTDRLRSCPSLGRAPALRPCALSRSRARGERVSVDSFGIAVDVVSGLACVRGLDQTVLVGCRWELNRGSLAVGARGPARSVVVGGFRAVARHHPRRVGCFDRSACPVGARDERGIGACGARRPRWRAGRLSAGQGLGRRDGV